MPVLMLAAMSGGKMKTWQYVLIAAGTLVIILAILDMLNIPLEIPTSCNTANLAIGAGLVATPFVFRKVLA